MKIIKKYGSNAFIAGLFVFGISFASLMGALFSQYVLDMHPCILCIYQRIPHGLNIVLGLIALLFVSHKPKLSAFFIFIAGLSFLAGSIIAAYHTGVEQEWWEGFQGCSFPKVDANDFEAFRQALLNAPVVSCKDIPFQLFGISMAGYNFILSLISFVLSLVSSILIMRKANNML